MVNLYAPIDAIYKTYQVNKSHWFWWLFFPMALANGLDEYIKASNKTSSLVRIYEIYNRLWWISKWFFPIIKTISQSKEFSIYQSIKSYDLDANIFKLYLKTNLPHEHFLECLRILKKHDYLEDKNLGSLMILKAPLANALFLDCFAQDPVSRELFFEKLCSADLSENNLNLMTLAFGKGPFNSDLFELLSQHPLNDLQFTSLSLLVDSNGFDKNLVQVICQLPETQLQQIFPLLQKLFRFPNINFLKVMQPDINQALGVLDSIDLMTEDNILLVLSREDRDSLVKCFSYMKNARVYNQLTRQIVVEEVELENLVWFLELSGFHLNETFFERCDKTHVYILLKTLMVTGFDVGSMFKELIMHPNPKVLNELIIKLHALTLLETPIIENLIKHPYLSYISEVLEFLSKNTALFKGIFAKQSLQQFLDFPCPVIFVKFLKYQVINKDNAQGLFKEIIYHSQPSYLISLIELFSEPNVLDSKLIEYLISHPHSLKLKSCFEALKYNIAINNPILIHLVNMVNEDAPIDLVLNLLKKNRLLASFQGADNFRNILQHRFLLFSELLKPFWQKIVDSPFKQIHLDKMIEICNDKLKLSVKIENIARVFLIDVMKIAQSEVDKKPFLSPELFLVEPQSSEIAFRYYQYFYPKSRDGSKVSRLVKKIKTLDADSIKKQNACNAVAQYSELFYDPISNVNLVSLFIMMHEVINQFTEPNLYWKELLESLDMLFLLQPKFEKMFDHMSKLLNSFYERQYSMKMNVLYMKDEIIGLIRENAEFFLKIFPDAQTLPTSILPVWDSIKAQIYKKTQGLLVPAEVDKMAQQIKVSLSEVRYKTLFISQINMLVPVDYQNSTP